MATDKQATKEVGVYFSETEAPYAWNHVACTTDISFNGTTESVSVNSRCEGTFASSAPGDTSWTMDISGYFKKEADPDISNETFLDLWINRTVGFFKFESDDGDYLRLGKGYISSFTESGTAGEYMTFTATVNGTEQIQTTEGS